MRNSFGQVLRIDGHGAVQVVTRSVCAFIIAFSTFLRMFLRGGGGGGR